MHSTHDGLFSIKWYLLPFAIIAFLLFAIITSPYAVLLAVSKVPNIYQKMLNNGGNNKRELAK